MARWDVPRHRIRTGNALVLLTLLSHLMATFGFPLPTATAHKLDDAGPAFPCQHRPCGCLSFDECWAGDCCCFTLEEKLAWADTNGVEPPDHVRPLLAARKTRPSAPPPKHQAACCCDAEEEGFEAPTTTCCPTDTTCHAKETTPARSGAIWVVGLFAQKCRGDSPAGLFHSEPAVPPAPISERIDDLSLDFALIERSHLIVSTSHCPPTPPPRRA